MNYKGLFFMSRALLLCLATFGLLTPLMSLAVAKEHPAIDWAVFNLNTQQRSNIQQLEGQWKQTYQQIYPIIMQDQKKLKTLLSEPDADETQVMMLQQQIHEHENRLRQKATQTYLKKKRLLTPQQQKKLDDLMQH